MYVSLPTRLLFPNPATNTSLQPTTTGTVTLVLLRGPSENILPLFPIVEKAPNSGTFTWTPPTTLEADVTHYGIQLIDDATGAYQYTSQFGISNSSPSSPSSTATATSTVAPISQISDGQPQAPTGSTTSTETSTATASTTTVTLATTSTLTSTYITSSIPSAIPLPISNTTTTYVVPALPSGSATTSLVVVQPSLPLTVPATLQTATTTVAGAATTGPAIQRAGAVKVVRGAGAALVGLAAVVWVGL